MTGPIDIEQAQERLGRTLDRAHAGEDRQLAREVRELGERVARLLLGLMRLTRMHDPSNDAFEKPVHDLHEAIDQLMGLLGTVHLVMVEDQVYVNDIRIRFPVGIDAGTGLVEAFRPHAVGGISFHVLPSAADLRSFVHRAAQPPPEGRAPRDAFQQWLAERGMNAVELSPVFRFRIHGEHQVAVNRDFQEVYNASTGRVSDVWANLSAGRQPNPLPVRRMVTDFIDLTRDEQEEELLTAAVDEFAPPHVRHTMHVSALSLLIGRELGLSEASLSDLGVAAMFHDVGYSADEDGYPPPFERHGTAGVRLLLRQRGFHEARIRRMLTALEHHRPYSHPETPHLYGRIVRIAEDYDILTRPRSGGPLAVPPDAIDGMGGRAGTFYDPTILQLFINRVGHYPPGSILELEDGSWVVSMSGMRAPGQWERPLTVVVRLPDGSPPPEEIMVDLAETPWRIRRVVRPRDEPAA